MLPSAVADLVNVLEYVTRESGNLDAGMRFVGALRQPCRQLAAQPGQPGRLRRELRPDIRSIAIHDIAIHDIAFNGYVIFFRYAKDVFEVVNIIEDNRDIECAESVAGA